MESVWSYPEQPTLEPERRRIQVEFNGVVLADTTRAVRIVERGLPPSFLVPPEDTRIDLVVRCEPSTYCPAMGEAQYWTVRVGEREAHRAAWSYPEPPSNCEKIRGYFAFYVDQVDRCTVGGEVAKGTGHPFYGGWITSEVEGPFVGDPDLPEEFAQRLAWLPVSETGHETFEELAANSFSIDRRSLHQ